MNCLAIDDEPLALNIIRDFCSRIDFIDLIATCTNPIEAIRMLNQRDIDLIFLDIQMPNITGLEFIRSLKNPPQVIFTTAYANYALDGFDLNATDYLVKPFSFERFLKAVNKAYEVVLLRKEKIPFHEIRHEMIEGEKFLMIKVEYRTVKVEIQQILFIEGLKDYIKIYLGKKPLLTKSTMKNIESKLPSDTFIRVHKSFIVAFPKIEAVENNRIVIGERLIPIGNQYKSAFYALLDSKRL
jgi:DNA-binding LytR/AlgR family response regulator